MADCTGCARAEQTSTLVHS